MFRYGIGVTDNPQVVESTLRAFNNNCFVITLEEQGSIFNLTLPNFTKGTILLPPPSAEIAAIDGDEHGFTELYFKHLCDLGTLEFMALMMYTAYFSMPVILFIPRVESYAANFLMDFFSFNFGVLLSKDCTQMVNPYGLPLQTCNVLALFYIFNFIDINIFMSEYRMITHDMNITFVPVVDLCLDKFCMETNYMPDPNCIMLDQGRSSKINHFLHVMNRGNSIIPFTMEGVQC